MAAHDSDGEEDFVTYGKPLEPYEEGEQPKKPIPLQDQTVKDEKGRYKRFHGAFTGGFSAGYFNTVGSKEGWTPSTFVSSRQGRSEKQVNRPEDYMDDEDLGEFGIAPNEIMTTDDFASKTKDRIREKARELASVTAPIPGATILEDLIAPGKITMGVQLLRQMGWKEGQGVGPRTKRRAQKQKPEGNVKKYGCALPPTGSEESEDEEDDYVPENITFAPKDVTPIDFTVKDNVHGLGYRGLNPHQALFGSFDTHVNLFSDASEKTSSLLGDVRNSRGRKVGISGQAFGVGAMEDDDDDIYRIDPLSKYDTVLREEETGDGLFGWTAPKEYKNKKGSSKEIEYIGKMLEGFCLATQSPPSKKIYPAPDLPRDYRPVHYFRPVIAENSQNSAILQSMIGSSSKPSVAPVKEHPTSRHQLDSSQRREILGEAPLQGPSSVLELLSEKDRERIRDVKQNLDEQRLKALKLAQEALKKRFESSAVAEKDNKAQQALLDRRLVPENAEEFRPFDKNPEKQKRYENYIRSLHTGQKDALACCLDSSMTEWERSREREEFMRSAMLYKPTNSHLSSRFTRGKHDDDSETVEVPRDQEGDMSDKAAAVKMKMFGKLTRDKFEWHPDRLLCRRFNIPDPYPGSTIIGLPKIKRDKYSVFNFLTVPETQASTNPMTSTRPEKLQQASENMSKKSSRWDVSAAEEKKTDSISEFLSQARSKSEGIKEESNTKPKDSLQSTEAAIVPAQGSSGQDPEEEEKRPPIDLFKAIFAESSDEKSSSSDEESEEDSSPAPNAEAETSKTETAASSSVQEPESTIKLTAPPAVPAAKEDLEKMDTEEFGPKLPPVPLSSGPPTSSTYSSGSLNEAAKKQKPKKHKEKHKVKKEHKHKKEKKKKHKKQKHKNKQKSRKTNEKSTDTDDSSESPSDNENVADITPRELLKRLKNLPIPHSQQR
ncbi:G patch domain-containing protein 1 isoform X2 [Bufo bufo]|uniref:G patch domain-containing protein 1 isoform X2 n=1 Tax=Bufo bufo TaxID=8384 RepID=UPI001ABE270F|nr:G patch domain-containing protein 1 isoform X2 [Bufo bufo]